MIKKHKPRRKTLTKRGRLILAKVWITKYSGQNIISGYAKWFWVDKICALNELKALGVNIPENEENQIVEAHKRRIEQRKTAKDKTEIFDMPVNDSDENFAFIAGYTSGGVPYGLTHEEYEKAEIENYFENDKFNIMHRQHHYNATIKWTGNKGTGTDNYRNYERSHQIVIENKPDILGSSDPLFRGNMTMHNPEDLLVSSLSSCHMLWYLHLCAESGVIVLDYTDNATGIMTENLNGGGQFSEVTLNPIVVVKESSMVAKANELHKRAHELCFIANSVNFPVRHNPKAMTK